MGGISATLCYLIETNRPHVNGTYHASVMGAALS